MILQKLHDARTALERAEAVANAAATLTRFLEAQVVYLNTEIEALRTYLARREITGEDLALSALELRRDTILYSLSTLGEHGTSFETARVNAQKAVDDLRELMQRSLDESAREVSSTTPDP